jgi:hypothetical protein
MQNKKPQTASTGAGPQQQAEAKPGGGSDSQNLSIPQYFDEYMQQFVATKVAEAKMDAAESRFRTYAAIVTILLAVVGIGLPIYQLIASDRRIDQAIQRMDQQFAQLAGKQLRKPKIECTVDGKDLLNSTVVCDVTAPRKFLKIYNAGDGTADFVKMRLFVKSKDEAVKMAFSCAEWGDDNVSIDPEYQSVFLYRHQFDRLAAQDFVSIPLVSCQPQEGPTSGTKVVALMKLSFGEAEPKQIPFTVEFKP